MTTYVWDHLDIGYMQVGSKLCIIIIGTFLLILQGMCDIVAPLLVVIDDEVNEIRKNSLKNCKKMLHFCQALFPIP